MHGIFIMNELPWPLHGGREVYTHNLLAQLLSLGHRIHVVLAAAPTDDRLAAWPLRHRVTCETLPLWHDSPRRSAWTLHAAWSRYFGWTDAHAHRLAHIAAERRADYVAGCGLSVLPVMHELPAGVRRIWLALDDPCLFQWSLLGEARGRDRLGVLKQAAAMALYERTYAARLDAAVAVSPADQHALHRIAGLRRVVLLPNGVDAELFRPPAGITADPFTALFWGRLDFQPNIDAIRFFALEVWPSLISRHPAARWRIVGRNPTDEVRRAIEGLRGIELIGPVEDIRPHIASGAVAVIPMRSGAGIKNKLLEAAAMARPIVASRRAVAGLAGGPHWHTAEDPEQWVNAVAALWADAAAAQEMGDAARRWVMTHHDWAAGARQFHRELLTMRRDTMEAAA